MDGCYYCWSVEVTCSFPCPSTSSSQSSLFAQAKVNFKALQLRFCEQKQHPEDEDEATESWSKLALSVC
ncbi:hypothetical protein ACLKA7_012442 [Drosophila subpalustris]